MEGYYFNSLCSRKAPKRVSFCTVNHPISTGEVSQLDRRLLENIRYLFRSIFVTIPLGPNPFELICLLETRQLVMDKTGQNRHVTATVSDVVSHYI